MKKISALIAATLVVGTAGGAVAATGALNVNPSTSNQKVFIDPVRVYDSRSGGEKIKSGQSVKVDVLTDQSNQSFSSGDVKGVDIMLTATDGSSSGWLAVVPGGQKTAPNTSVLNLGSSPTVANGFSVKVDDGQIILVAGGGATTNYVIDIMAYYI